jgi:hydroxyacylglutathione hydrolase
MFLETVRSEGLAHLSYIFGDKGKAAVVDPRRDCEVYIDIAYREAPGSPTSSKLTATRTT